MSELLNSGIVGNIELNTQKKIYEQIQNRWDSIGMLEGLEGNVKESIATIFENQAKHLLSEATSANNSGSFETVVFPLIRRTFSRLLANDIVSVQSMTMPVGRVFYICPETSKRDWNYQDQTKLTQGDTGRHHGLMGYERTNMNQNGAQMNRYYLPDEAINPINSTGDFVAVLKTDDSKKIYGRTYEECVNAIHGNTSGSQNVADYTIQRTEPVVSQYMKKTLYDLFYNDFLYDNSKGKVTINVGTANPVKIDEYGNFSELTPNQIEVFGQDGTVRSLIIAIEGFNSYNRGHLTGPDGNEVDAETFLASLKVILNTDIESNATTGTSAFKKDEELPIRIISQRYGSAIIEGDLTANGKLYIEVDLTKPVSKQGLTMDGYIGVDPEKLKTALMGETGDNANKITSTDKLFTIAWASYDSLELETEMGEVSFSLKGITIEVIERKLRATWSPELSQDVQAFHSLDAEAELTALMSEQMGGEVDREILRDIRKAAPWTTRWDHNGYKRQVATPSRYTQKEWNQLLVTDINKLSAQIMKSTLMGGADWIVVSPEIGAVLNDLQNFYVTDASANNQKYTMGIEKIGAMQNNYNVIVDSYAPHWSLIMGHHGTSLLDTGYIYAPYIPMVLTPTVINSMNFAPVKGISTRYAKKIVNNRYYASIRVDGLTHFDVKELR